mmetsp:Transcript_23899/g.33198  ORF Transcript_23899/g.33198 Transcript_23899/m.33198 type:complete len:145 (-) Transcript_23899:126-560(-)
MMASASARFTRIINRTRGFRMRKTFYSAVTNHSRIFGKFSPVRHGLPKVNFSSSSVDKMLDELTDKFTEARMEIADALDSKETVYFNEDAKIALEVTEDTLNHFETILKTVDDETKVKEIKTSWGMRIEQLKQEAELLKDADDH